MRASKNKFSFKQFTIFQDNCAMKVCTDSCIFGALINLNNANKLLDIGAGTGLLSLMQAQKAELEITAIEIDQLAAEQCKENVLNSNWSSQIRVLNQSIQSFASKKDSIFDCIISNPPFFENNLKSGNILKNKAKHNESLSLIDLAFCVNNLLAKNGCFWVLLPDYEMGKLKKELEKYGIILNIEVNIKNRISDTDIFRVVACFSLNKPSLLEKKEFIIFNSQNEYSTEMKILLKDYYLNF